MIKFHEISPYLQDIESLVKNLKTELDLTRNLLYHTCLKQGDGLQPESNISTPTDIDFQTGKDNSVLTVQSPPGSNYEKICNQLRVLGFRSGQIKQGKPLKIHTSRLLYDHIKPYLDDQPYESFYIILLNTGKRVLKTVCISEGGISGTVVDVKKIFRIALDHFASGIFLSHNHPSGNLQPSPSDQILTKKIIESGKLLDINVIDHLIIGSGDYFSFSDEGIMG